MDEGLCTRRAAVVGVVNQHRTKFREVAPKETEARGDEGGECVCVYYCRAY